MFVKRQLLVLAVLIVSYFYTLDAFSACSESEIGPHQVELNLNGTTIVLLGWNHIADAETEILGGALKSVTLNTDTACSEIEENLAAAQSLTRDTFSNYLEMKSLITPYAINGYEIAIEMTPNELGSHYSGISRLNERLSPLVARCPLLRKEVTSIKNVLFGPEFTTSQEYNSPILPVEDQAIKDENAKAFANPELDTFDFQNPQITEDGHQALEEIRNKIMTLEYPSPALLERVIAYEVEELERIKLRQSLNFSITVGMQQISGAYRRNEAIAEALLKTDTKKVMPIGFRHVDDLKEKLLNICLSSSINSDDSELKTNP